MLSMRGSMKTPSTLAITRAAGLAVWGVTAIPGVLTVVLPPPETTSQPSWFVRALALTSFVAFGPAFWWNARRVQGRSPTRRSVVVLGLQVAAALLTVSDLVILVALEIPFVLMGSAAVLFSIALVLVSAVRALAAGGQGFLGPLPWLSHLPFGFVVGLSVVTNAIWQGLAFAGGYLVASQHRSSEELVRVNADLVATQQLLTESSRLAERLHISRELHDAAGHHLAALSLNLELAVRRNDGAVEPVREAQAVVKLLLADVRDMVSTLRQHRSLDLRRALATLAAGTHAPRVHLAFPEDVELTDPSQAHAVFRCVQEAITNAVRHARAQNVWVELGRGAERFELHVRDDGCGAAQTTTGNGLLGMRERFEHSGGGLDVATRPGHGFYLSAWLPVRGDGT